MSKSNFEITRLVLIHPVDVATVPDCYFDSVKFRITLCSDPRFVEIEALFNKKHPPTLVPLSNVRYMFLKEFAKEEKVKK